MEIQKYHVLKKQGRRLGRQMLAERVIALVRKWDESDGSYIGAIQLAGRLHAIALACRFDSYWEEKAFFGFHDEFHKIQRFCPEKK
jgi:hypothetical protein